MGISQLLPFLEKSTKPCHVSEFRGHTVAVDSYCWLHKGARSCAIQLAKGENTDLYIQYCMKYVKLLLSYDIKPIMVFDGRHLPAKKGTEAKRRESKKQARKQAMDYLRLGQTNEAYKYFCQCIEVTPEMALALIRECRKVHVDCIVAPYESDAQLAFFSIKNIADCVISEDSDLLLFGCKKVLYKMDSNGSGQLVESDKIHLSMKMRPDEYSFEKFRHMCILSGCDYLDSLPGIGLKKAFKFITLTAETDPMIFIDRIPRYLNMKSLTVPADYKENFLSADATFKHQTVFDPFKRILVALTEVVDNQYCNNSGEFFDETEAYQLALGNLDPLTMKRIDDWKPSDGIVSEFSIWSSRYRPRALPISTPKRTLKKPSILTPPNSKLQLTECDKQVESELEYYKTSPKLEKPVKETMSPNVQEDTSPVLGVNPFIRQKICKFQGTTTKSDQLVISRFFHRKGSSSTATIDDGNRIEEEKVPATDEDIQNQTPDENLLPSSVECECLLVVDEDTTVKIEETSTLISLENIPDESRGVKRKVQTITKKKVGKKMTGKQITGKQMTIHDMIKKMKMN